MDFKKLDYQKLITYGILLLIGVYFLRDVLELDFRIPILEGQANQEETAGAPVRPRGSDPDSFVFPAVVRLVSSWGF